MQKEKKWELFLNMIISEQEPIDIVKRAIDSVKDFVDGMYIAVTYKDKEPKNSKLIKLLKLYKANVSLFKWANDFGQARQFITDKTPKGSGKFFVWVDSDDVFKDGKNISLFIEDMISFIQRWEERGEG